MRYYISFTRDGLTEEFFVSGKNFTEAKQNLKALKVDGQVFDNEGPDEEELETWESMVNMLSNDKKEVSETKFGKWHLSYRESN